jgi:hypothetical protein
MQCRRVTAGSVTVMLPGMPLSPLPPRAVRPVPRGSTWNARSFGSQRRVRVHQTCRVYVVVGVGMATRVPVTQASLIG